MTGFESVRVQAMYQVAAGPTQGSSQLAVAAAQVDDQSALGARGLEDLSRPLLTRRARRRGQEGYVWNPPLPRGKGVGGGGD